jgi:ribosomal protein L32
MPVPKRRRSRARRDRGRTHKGLRPDCGRPKLPHRACTNPDCGTYRGRQVITQPIST